ncbi:hypothetical protein KK083_08230 [Fulvivirgaceae bacterium PWU4]|uniref:Uncharacterized protein n=1 Tax=Chryseosolibacter histidini TaxID=2782349 RepID=A0AAP2DIL2_9BACT|nr:hypothetical protein [Chryseosolibacter histidini]MBT1696855.1 hypothetical protein [Chryseosolibacter histidini]
MIVVVGYMLYFVIGISSTFPSIKEYHFATSQASFEEKLTARINASNGWSLENTDTVKGEKGDACYWASLTYQENGQHLKYDIKYCADGDDSNNDKKCFLLYIVGAFDYVNKSGGYKSSDKDVSELLQVLDRALLTDFAPDCSDR